ncbi:MAG TPA: SusC/RagA family TonB-linked outer membrane protein [Chitinophagaceae bacterium]|nr:SusC/RagA family TonB-linked outer membrane protein [Chitinophagaceae bacterium]
MKKATLHVVLTMLLCVMGIAVFAQTRQISGTVTDSKTNTPLLSVTVKVKDKNIQAITGDGGAFTLTAPSGVVVLEFSYVGYSTKEVTVGAGENNITVALEEGGNGLNDVVVTALGVKRSPRALGYTTQQVGGVEVSRSNAPNVGAALSGRVASLNVISPNGVDGGTTKLVIDGNNSITGNNQPLIVVDGVPMNNDIPANAQSVTNPQDFGSPLNLLNAEDIESYNVLKGPAAAALYGGRGANGVIMITTKKGTKKKGLGIDYTLAYKSIDPYRYIKMQNEYGAGGMTTLNAPYYRLDGNGNPALSDGWDQQFVDDKTGSGPFGVNSWDQVSWPGNGLSWGPKMTGTNITWWDGSTRADVPQPGNLKLLYQNGNQLTHTVAVQGGGEWGSIRVSYSHLDNTAILPNSNFNQSTFNIGSNLKVSDKVSVQVNASYFDNKYLNAPMLGNDDVGSWQKKLLYNSPRNYAGEDILAYKNPDGTRNDLSSFPWVGNNRYQVWDIYENNETVTRRKLLGSMQVNYQATSFLDFMFRAGIDANNNEDLKENHPIDLTGTNGGLYAHGLSRDNTTDIIGIGTLHKDDVFVKGLNGKLGIGAESFDRDAYGLTGTNNNWSVANFYSFSTYQGTPVATSESGQIIRNKQNSVFGFLNLAYKDYLFLDFTGRNDWSSALPSDEQSYFYPSVSSSFVFTELMHLNPKVLSFGKIRAAMAQGAVPPDPFLVNFTYNTGTFAGQPTSSLPGTLPAFHYKPQTNTTYDFGLTLGFLDNRINVDMRYYHGKAENQIVQTPLPNTSGVSSLYVSQGSLQNSGYEISINAKVINTRKFRWDATLNLSHNSNKLLALAPGADRIDLGSIWGSNGPTISAKVGDQFGTIYGYDYVYDKKTGLPLLVDAPFGNPDMKGTMYQATSTTVPIGNATPKVIGGISNVFTFGNLSIGTLVDWKLGGDMWSGSYGTIMQQGQSVESLKERDGGGLPYTTPDGTKTNWGVILPGVYSDGSVNSTVVHYFYKYIPYGVWSSGSQYSNWIEKNDIVTDTWIKMREISINYTLPNKLVQKSHVFQAATVSLVGRDLFYIYTTVPDRINPEGMNGVGNAQGIEFASLPGVRSLGVQLRVSF